MLRLLQGRKLSKDAKEFRGAIEWIRYFPKGVPESLRVELITTFKKVFDVSDEEIAIECAAIIAPSVKHQNKPLAKIDREAKLHAMVPKDTWLDWYAKYTLFTESPLSYHLFSSLCVLGTALGRRVYKPSGFYNIFPNYCTILVGPTGRVKKTSAVNIATAFIQQNALCPILADKLTPEALVDALKESGHHYVPAPEFAVFFNKQKYNEGLSQQIIRMLDCPSEFKVRTHSRGEEVVHDVALSILGATTPSLLNDSSAREATSHGFLNRFLLVIENDTDRCHPEPRKGDPLLAEMINSTIQRLAKLTGPMHFNTEAADWWADWYLKRKQQLRNLDETAAASIERGQDHAVRTAMLLHLANCDSFAICQTCLKLGCDMIAFVEETTPTFVKTITSESQAQETGMILHALNLRGGSADHSTLLRRVSNKMSAATFKANMTTLIESGQVSLDQRGAIRIYTLKGEL